MEAIPKINVKDLKQHPMNTQIYGEEDIKELAEKIKESGWVKPLVITPDGTVISGHRRLRACLMLGIEEVEYEAVYFNNKNEELERLLLENQSREKTNEQKIREGLMWEKVIKEKAKLRMSVGGQGKEKIPTHEKGQTRDIVAEQIDIGSGKTYETAKKVVKQIDKLKEEGKEKEAEFLKTTLNDSVNAAKKIANTDLTKFDNELKDKVISKEVTPKQAIKEMQNEGKENFPQDKQISKEAIKEIKKQAEPEEITSVKEEMKVCSKCGQEKSIHNFYEGKNQCIECCKLSRNPKDVYGNEIKIDKEKIKGIDIEAIIANVKDTNKDINIIDGESIAMELSCNIDMFVQSIGKYVEMEEQFDNMKKENIDKIMGSITSIEEVINKIKGFLY